MQKASHLSQPHPPPPPPSSLHSHTPRRHPLANQKCRKTARQGYWPPSSEPGNDRKTSQWKSTEQREFPPYEGVVIQEGLHAGEEMTHKLLLPCIRHGKQGMTTGAKDSHSKSNKWSGETAHGHGWYTNNTAFFSSHSTSHPTLLRISSYLHDTHKPLQASNNPCTYIIS